MDENPRHDPKYVQQVIAPVVQASFEAGIEDGWAREELDKLDPAEVALWVWTSADVDEQVEAAVDEALDLPWQDGPSLRERFDGSQECC